AAGGRAAVGPFPRYSFPPGYLSAIAFISFEWFLLYHTLGEDAPFFLPHGCACSCCRMAAASRFLCRICSTFVAAEGSDPLGREWNIITPEMGERKWKNGS
ncbi:hypothetical protein P9711_12590, partial [Anoxybacillus geothermalis]|nr:hypothetical protein [Anoxybacillus geothermalis]